jgi:hypothetical protein
MEKLNERIEFLEMTEDDPELLVMLLELRRHRLDNWKQRAEAAEAKEGQLVKQPQRYDAHGFQEPAYIINSRWIEAIRAAGYEVQE